MDSEVKELTSIPEKVVSEDEYNQGKSKDFFDGTYLSAKSMPVTIDDEFKELIPRISKVEYEHLEENILEDGVRDEIVIWKTEDGKIIILDGHNRYDICLKHDLECKIKLKVFKTREEAIDYIIRNQLGRRNLTPEQKRYLIGKQYELEKKASHRPEKIEKEKSGKKHHLKTAEKMAKEYKVSEKYIRDSGKYAKNIDILGKNVGPEIKEGILDRNVNLSIEETRKFAGLERGRQREVMRLIDEYKVESISEAISLQVKKKGKNVKKWDPTLFNENSIEWLHKINDKSMDFLITSPPSKENVAELKLFAESWLTLALSKINDTGSAYIFTSSKPEEIKVYLDVLLDLPSYNISHFEFVNILSWHYGTNSKRIPEQAQKLKWQPIFYLTGKKAKGNKLPNTAKNFSLPSTDILENGHNPSHYYFQVPDRLAKIVIKYSTDEYDYGIDPFAGIGTFLSACKELNRLSSGCEKNSDIFNIAEKNGCKTRINAMTHIPYIYPYIWK